MVHKNALLHRALYETMSISWHFNTNVTEIISISLLVNLWMTWNGRGEGGFHSFFIYLVIYFKIIRTNLNNSLLFNLKMYGIRKHRVLRSWKQKTNLVSFSMLFHSVDLASTVLLLEEPIKIRSKFLFQNRTVGFTVVLLLKFRV